MGSAALPKFDSTISVKNPQSQDRQTTDEAASKAYYLKAYYMPIRSKFRIKERHRGVRPYLADIYRDLKYLYPLARILFRHEKSEAITGKWTEKCDNRTPESLRSDQTAIPGERPHACG
jgi:hypothetical protein